MLYRINPKNQDKISQLGFGCMRFPKKGGSVDLNLVANLIKRAIDMGVNYFDTAYIYPGIEQALGTVLAREGLRDKVKIATKLPLFMCKTNNDFDRLFEIQLKRLQTDKIDYYLMHMLSSKLTWTRLKEMGIEEWIEKQKKSGKITNIGFSYHGGRNEFKEIIDAYDWDFCMIQYNYFDENNQAGRSGLTYANNKGVPVFIMEPLRGGVLVNGLPESAENVFKKVNPKRSMADWALRWLFNQPEITTVLSGMNSLSQVEENIKIANESSIGSLTVEDEDAYREVLSIINKAVKIPCTGCGYCLPCPAGVDIPTCFSCYNEIYSTKFITAMRHYLMTTGSLTPNPGNASKCIKCGKCEQHCPQGIEIRKRLKDVSRKLEPFWYKPLLFIARKIARV